MYAAVRTVLVADVRVLHSIAAFPSTAPAAPPTHASRQERGLYETIEASKVTWCLGVCYSMRKPNWAQAEKILKDSLRMKLKRAGRAALEVDSRVTLRVA